MNLVMLDTYDSLSLTNIQYRIYSSCRSKVWDLFEGKSTQIDSLTIIDRNNLSVLVHKLH